MPIGHKESGEDSTILPGLNAEIVRKLKKIPPKQLPGSIMFVESEEKVNHPSHYNQGKIEVIDFIEDQQLDFHEGNTVKYVCRAKHKGNELEDLKKAAWYLQRKIEKLEGKKEDGGKPETTNSR